MFFTPKDEIGIQKFYFWKLASIPSAVTNCGFSKAGEGGKPQFVTVGIIELADSTHFHQDFRLSFRTK